MASATVPKEAASWQVYEFDPQPPEEGGLEHLAHRILGLKDPTRQDILWMLWDQQRGHSELEKGLDRNPGLIHRALKALEQDGLIIQQVQARQRPVTRSYRLTPSGVLVVELIERFQEATQRTPLEVKTEKGTFLLYSRDVPAKGGRRRVYFFVEKGASVKDARPEPSPPNHRLTVPHASAPVLE